MLGRQKGIQQSH